MLTDADGAQAGHQVDVPAGNVTIIKLKATSQDGKANHVYEIQVTGPGSLGAPSVNRPIAAGVESLTVSWVVPSNDGGSAITAYDLRHIRSDAASKAEGNWTVVQDVWTGSGSLQYVLTGLANGTQYDVQVRAVNVAGDGPWSVTVTGTTSATAPETPTGLTATGNGQTQIDLSWTVPSDDGGAAIAGYRIEVSEDRSSWSDLVTDTRSNSTSYSHTGLTAGSTRYYRVSAINAAGVGQPSNVVSATTGAAAAPDLVVDPPTVSESAPDAGTSFTLNATVRNQGNGSSAFTTLRYYQSGDSTITTGDTQVGTDYVSSLDASESEDDSVGLTAPSTPGTYYYGACVGSVSGESDTENNCSTAVTVTVSAPASGPNSPTGLAATANGQTRIDLAWRTPSDDGGSAITGYRIEVSEDNSNWSDLVANTGSTSTSYSHSGLTAGSTRHYRVSAINSAGTGDPSNIADATTESQANDAPKAVGTVPEQVITPREEITIDVSPYFNDPDRDILSYSADSSLLFNLLSVSGSTVAMRYDGLLCQPRTVTVTAQDEGGLEATQQFTVRRFNNPPVASSGTFPSQTIDVGESSPLYMGNWFSDPDTCDSRLAYSADSSDSSKVSVSASGNTMTVRGVAAGSATVTVTARDSENLEATLDIQVTVTEAAGRLGAPTGLTATPNGQTRIELSWTAPSDDGGSAITGYRIEVSEDNSNWSDLVANTGSTSTSYSHTGLTAGTTRHYRVSAINSARTGPASNAANATTDVAAAPDVVLSTPRVSDNNRNAGDSFFLNITVENQGRTNSQPTTLRFYRSADSTITSSDSQLDTDSVPLLGPGGGYVASTSLTAPSTPGTYYYGACVDPVSGESDTQNNCSTAVTVTVSATASVPDSPTGVTATANGQTQINLSWTAPSDDGGADITGYRIEVSEDSSNWSDLETDIRSTNTSYSHRGLPAGSTWHYRVSAINSAGIGPTSNVANATTEPDTSQQDEASACAADGAVPDPDNNPGLVADCEALLAAKDTLRGTGNLNWSAGTSIRQWDAITVGGTPSRVIKLDTSGEGLTLTGTIPAELGNLPALTNLRLSNNELTGAIPADLGNLANLQSLSLWNNELTGAIPAELGNLTNLTFLRLNWNDLAGTIPAELGNLTNLESLYLGNNRLTGKIPVELGRLSNLRHLLLGTSSRGRNQLTGPIPSELNKLTKLQSLNLWNNRLTGQIPTWLGNRTGLRTLILAGNQFTGTIPSELGNLTQVGQLWLHENQLTGTIPAEFGNLTNVKELSLRNNRLTGEIPAELANLSGLRQLFLASNQLTGCIPAGLRDVATQHDLTQLSLPDCGSATDPGAPTGVTATANGQTQINLSWTAPSDDGGADITGYRIEVSEDSSNWSDLETDTRSTNTSYSHRGLPAGSTWHYRVSAINSAGIGPTSNVANATTDAATAPGAPTGLTATANGETQIDLTWTAPSDDGGEDITGYRIEVSEDSSNWSDLVGNTGSTSTSYSHTSLDPGSTRHYRVSAINSAGTGPASNTANATTAQPPASDGTCSVDLIVRSGESCTYPGTSDEFSVDSSGTGHFLLISAGSKIELRNSNINGVT